MDGHDDDDDDDVVAVVSSSLPAGIILKGIGIIGRRPYYRSGVIRHGHDVVCGLLVLSFGLAFCFFGFWVHLLISQSDHRRQ